MALNHKYLDNNATVLRHMALKHKYLDNNDATTTKSTQMASRQVGHCSTYFFLRYACTTVTHGDEGDDDDDNDDDDDDDDDGDDKAF